LQFQVFAKEKCDVCTKAQEVLRNLGVDYQVRYVEGADATPENLADMAWFDWADKAPLVAAIEDGRMLKRWDGSEIADTKQKTSWTLAVRDWLSAYRAGAGNTAEGLPAV
jgi:hypothetical protein